MKKKYVAEQFEIPAAQIQRADGAKLFNKYLWPTESWWLHENPHYHSDWHFGYVALMDGRFCLDGAEYHIRDDDSLYFPGRKNNFLTREAAIRAACARLIIQMRWARRWDSWHGGMTGKRLEFAINWALQKCYAVCRSKRKPRRVTINPPPPPPPQPPTHAGILQQSTADDWSAL